MRPLDIEMFELMWPVRPMTVALTLCPKHEVLGT